MKKIILLSAFLACVTVCANAQTSLDDYHYVTTGFKEDMYKGSGIKPGYSLENVGTTLEIKRGSITKSAHLFYFKVNNVVKALMIKIWDSESNREYYCIPTADSDSALLSLASNTISNSSGDTKELIERLLMNQNCQQSK